MMNTFPPNCIAWVIRSISRLSTVLGVIPYMDSSVYAALYASALDRNLHSTFSGSLDFDSRILGSRSALDKYRTHPGNEFLGEVEAALEQIGDDDGLGTCSARRQERHKTNRSSAARNRSVDHK